MSKHASSPQHSSRSSRHHPIYSEQKRNRTLLSILLFVLLFILVFFILGPDNIVGWLDRL